MFSSALKSISSTNISSNYSISPTPTSTAGPWKIHDCRKKSTGKTYSVFVFDRKSLDSHGSSSVSRSSGASSFKRSVDEVVERLKKEASSLAKLRHPSILELVEPVEETRGGGLQFVTEAVTASLAGLLRDKDGQERVGGRSSRFVTEDADGVRRRREVELDELEIQKGLLQISKALDFLHEHAGLVHGNLTPDAVLSDWKLSGLSFCSPADGSTKPTSIQGVSLSEVLNLDPRLPPSVQLNLDYTSPDFVMDSNLTPSADMFSLGILSVALYNSPHKSPIECHGSVSTYKRAFSSSSTVPTASNNFFSSRPLPKDLAHHVLPKLITRRPAHRMTAKEFQASEYFDNVLVSTIRFLDTFPAKTPSEKSQFLRGLVKVLPSFPRSVMEKKLLPALLDEMKDKELLSLILQNVFKIVSLLPSARRAFGERVRPALKTVFVDNAKQSQDKDAARDAGLMVFLEQISVVADNCNGKEFKDDILPVIIAAVECPTPSIVDVALGSFPVILPVLDFSTIKNELFPAVAAVFSKTSSLAIKVRGLEAFSVLCGSDSVSKSSSALDKFTMQEKIIPLIKAIKTKEPAVMMAARNLLSIIGQAADADFVAMDMLPILWSMSLGPLLNLAQFQAFMELIRALSRRVEEEQTRKLQDLSVTAAPSDDLMVSQGVDVVSGEDDFEALVKGRNNSSSVYETPVLSPARSSEGTPAPSFPWSTPPPMSGQVLQPQAPSFSWSTPPPAPPTTTMSSQVLQPQTWSTATNYTSVSAQPSGFSLAPPPSAPRSVSPRLGMNVNSLPMSTGSMNLPMNSGSMNLAPKNPGSINFPTNNGNGMMNMNTSQKSGLDKYESLI